MSFGASALFVAWVVGQLARDATWITGLCFYIPSVVMVVVLVAIAGLSAVMNHRRPALMALGFALPPLLFVGLVENHFGLGKDKSQGEFRLIHWNTGGRPGRPGIGEYMVNERADLYVLTDIANAAHVGVLRDQLGVGYQAITFANLAVIGRGEIRANGWLRNSDGFEVQAVTWTLDGKQISVFVVDLPSEVWIARNPLLREVNELISQHSPDLVVGDFNAPRRSWGLVELPEGYHHAYHTAGGGWGYTWPVPVPVYALDHTLHGPRVVPASYRLGGMGGNSDHRYQVFDFSLAAPRSVPKRSETGGTSVPQDKTFYARRPITLFSRVRTGLRSRPARHL
ncbi:endonuclease/exonuclease/phosphatase family protein [Fimbriiglobus ruber]|uniref:endonuclease/exonuclease/phosphatase family protein n=1 Tax=Fimbriiglobus ruber TaxID=1908690 RepID=UPI000B4A5884|nr:endonuclease/exonuclease/phosphatase family protein [Fimbriiglobus ruber]